MPLTKEHMLTIVNEGLAMRDYCDRLRSELQSLVDQYLNGQDPAMLMELVMSTLTGDRRRPPMEVTFAESQKLRSHWKQNDWRKRHIAMRRAIEKGGGDPNNAQMHPHPISGSRYTHIGVSEEDKEAAIAKARARAEWLAERMNKAEGFIRGDITQAEIERLGRPDDASALPSQEDDQC